MQRDTVPARFERLRDTLTSTGRLDQNGEVRGCHVRRMRLPADGVNPRGNAARAPV
jgi:hypothetical protein